MRSIELWWFSTLAVVLLVKIVDVEATDNKNDFSSSHSIVELPGVYTYGVMLDCGSSGTRAHIFVWDSSVAYSELLNDIEPMREKVNNKPITKKITPGLASLKNDPSKASEYLQPLIDFITTTIPKEGHKSTAIYILATAGMRMLEEDTQKSIMNDIAAYLRDNYNFAQVKTDVIPGSAEGMYQWITVNSKSRRFGHNVGSEVGTYGVLEMGGASLQVTYQLKPEMRRLLEVFLAREPEARRAFENAIVQPKISRETPNHDYSLVSVTFLGFGGNSVRLAYLDMLVMEHYQRREEQSGDLVRKFSSYFGFKSKPYSKKHSMSLKDPCLPRGASETIERPIKMLSSKRQTIGFIIEEGDEIFKVKVSGTGKYTHCKVNVENFLFRSKNEKLNCKDDEPCTMSLIGTKFVPFHTVKYLGLADFYHTTNLMLELAGEYHSDMIVDKTKSICESSLKSLEKHYPEANKFDKTRYNLECFKAVWIDTFLNKGIGMPDDYDGLMTVKHIKGDDIDWTLGAVLDNSLAIEKAAEVNAQTLIKVKS